MKIPEKYSEIFYRQYITLAVFSFVALLLTFLVSNTDLSFLYKAAVFSLVVSIYLVSVFILYYKQKKRAAEHFAVNSASEVFSSEREEKLLILEEASEFFASSLKSADMFRLIASRVKEIIPFSSCVLFLVNDDGNLLNAVYTSGENKQILRNLTIKAHTGLAGKTYTGGKPFSDKKLGLDQKIIPAEILKGLKSSIAVPLRKNAEIFGVFQLFGSSENDFDENSLVLIEAIGERIAPLLSGSMAFERSLFSAMTDSLTELPNERAFYLMLENQIAEAQRLPEKRQLTVMVTDIKDFNELNQRFGHSTGDKILAFAAKSIKSQLRQMDFLSRSVNDEFFAVLPTATQEITETIIKRIERTFILQPFEVSKEEKVHLKLNFGTATFLDDCETANQLLQTALLRKHQGKADQPSNIIWFPKEYVN